MPSDRGRLPAAGRPRRPAAPGHPGRLRAARRRRGARGRRRPGHRHVRLRHRRLRARSTSSPGPATSTSPRPSGCSAGWSAPTREAGPDRDRDHRRPHRRPGLRGRRPDRPGRARPAGRLPADHHRPRPAPTGPTPSWPGRCRGAGTATGRRQALAGQSACVLVDDMDAALAVADAWAPEHLEIQAEDAAERRRAGSATPAPSSSGRTPRSRSATTWPAPTTCCPPAARPGTPAGLSVLPFLRCINVVECSPRGAWPGPPRTSTRSAAAEDLAAHVAAVRVRVPSEHRRRDEPRTAATTAATAPTDGSDLPLRDDLAGLERRTARRSSTSRSG